jgi:N-acetylmuramic acid 6-phosphate etherase
MRDLEVSEKDTVIGIAASRRTPFVVAALKLARKLGARTALMSETRISAGVENQPPSPWRGGPGWGCD